jgi:hypothetical protein
MNPGGRAAKPPAGGEAAMSSSWAKFNAKVLSVFNIPRFFVHKNELVYKLGVDFAKYWAQNYGKKLPGVSRNKNVYNICRHLL